MKSKPKYILPLVSWVALAVLLTVFLYLTQRYQLSFRGQQRLLVLDWSIVSGQLCQPGGFSALLEGLLTQFFGSLLIGPLVTSILIVFSALMISVPLRRLKVSFCSRTVLSVAAPLFLTVSLQDWCFYYQGVTAYALSSLFFCLYSVIETKDHKHRILEGSVFTVLLFWMAGSAACLFAVSALFYDFLAGRKKAFLSLCYPLSAFLCGVLCVWTGNIGTFSRALTPVFFHEMMAGSTPFVHYLSWILLPVALCLGAFAAITDKDSIVVQTVLSLFFAIAVILPFTVSFKSLDDKKMASFCKLEHFASKGDWDGIIATCEGNIRSDEEANYLNMALAQKGELLENLFKHRQRGPFALITDTKSQDSRDLVRLSRVLFTMGNMAAAQCMAFNANQALDRAPTLQKMICQIDLMRGSYGAASKSLSLLEKTSCRSWAKEQRRFLNDDEAVENDPVLGNSRRDFPKEEAFVLFTNPMDDLYRIVDANPSDVKAVQYALSYLLLAKDMTNVVKFVDERYGSPALEKLPSPVKECLAFFSDFYQSVSVEFAMSHCMSEEDLSERKRIDRGYCLSHGVDENMFERLSLFNEKFGLVKSGQKPMSELSSFMDTFWYYLLFVDVKGGTK